MIRIALIACCLLPLLPPEQALSQVDDLRMPVIIDAERTDYDGKTSMLEFEALRLTQGDISIEAELARASRMDFDDSVWEFRGDVVFDLAEGRITCQVALLEFSDFQLMRARIEGSPATFRFRRAGSRDATYAEAARLDYDVPAGLVEFSGGATINEGGNRISSESLVYNIGEQRINAVSAADGQERVKVTYTPPDAGDKPASGETAEAPGDDDAGREADRPAEPAGDAGNSSQAAEDDGSGGG